MLDERICKFSHTGQKIEQIIQMSRLHNLHYLKMIELFTDFVLTGVNIRPWESII